MDTITIDHMWTKFPLEKVLYETKPRQIIDARYLFDTSTTMPIAEAHLRFRIPHLPHVEIIDNAYPLLSGYLNSHGVWFAEERQNWSINFYDTPIFEIASKTPVLLLRNSKNDFVSFVNRDRIVNFPFERGTFRDLDSIFSYERNL